MRKLVLPLASLFALLIASAPAFGQQSNPASSVTNRSKKDIESPGKQKVEAAYAYQRKLMRGLITIPQAAENWAKTANDPEVRRDKDALAIALGCEGLMDIEQDKKLAADSVLTLSMPYFQQKKSKAYFVVALSELDKKLSFYEKAMHWYADILHTLDSVPELDEIEFYHASGYAPLAYAIDAALGVAMIGWSKEEFHSEAVALLRETLDRHPTDALGVMSLMALGHLDPVNQSDYKFKLDLLCSRKADLRKVSDNFERQFAGMKQQ